MESNINMHKPFKKILFMMHIHTDIKQFALNFPFTLLVVILYLYYELILCTNKNYLF